MGADAAEAARLLAEGEAKAPGVAEAYAKRACIECDVFGPWCDGQFNYCAEHVPHELRYRGSYWQKDYEKS